MSDNNNNEEAQVPTGEEFKPKAPANEQIESSGHQPGKIIGEPEFHLQTLPAGSAPADATFEPQVDPAAEAADAKAAEDAKKKST